mmetsp:Transcript_18747/g.36735  ORF Transcript_18747/g.36735 Transcript_18747/m.36735 type:complete len:213 (+) Transcript_18747:1352-1990(+)
MSFTNAPPQPSPPSNESSATCGQITPSPSGSPSRISAFKAAASSPVPSTLRSIHHSVAGLSGSRFCTPILCNASMPVPLVSNINIPASSLSESQRNHLCQDVKVEIVIKPCIQPSLSVRTVYPIKGSSRSRRSAMYSIERGLPVWMGTRLYGIFNGSKGTSGIEDPPADVEAAIDWAPWPALVPLAEYVAEVPAVCCETWTFFFGVLWCCCC